MNVLVANNGALINHTHIAAIHSLLSDEEGQVIVCAIAEVESCAGMLKPDIIVIVAPTDVISAVATVRASVSSVTPIPLLVIGLDDNELSIYRAVMAGADGYIPMCAPSKVLAATLRGMAHNELGLSRVAALAVVRRLRQTFIHPAKPTPNIGLEPRLTRREREVFELVRCGKRSREIAEELCIAETTVYKHIQNVLSKLQVHNRARVVLTDETLTLDTPAMPIPVN